MSPQTSWGNYVGFLDKNGRELKEGQTVATYDRTGKRWLGKIVRVDMSGVLKHPFIETGRTLFAFKSNYETFINDQEYASRLEIISE